jgi:two-component system nitrate/nitrite response regulator NarL
MKRIRILIVHNHTVVREGLCMLIANDLEMVVVGEAENSADALAIAARERPDVILVDLDLGAEDAIDSLSALIASTQGSRMLILTGTRDPEQHCLAVRLGAAGVFLKDQAGKILIKAIRKVHAGEAWLDRSMTAKVLTEFAHAGTHRRNEPEAAKIETLSARERQVITLVAEGLKTKQIAERLFISEKTVGNHLTTIYHKLDVSNRLELALYACRHKLAKWALRVIV